MLRSLTERPTDVSEFAFTRIVFNVGEGEVVSSEEVTVTDDMDFLGGIGRSFKILADHEVQGPSGSRDSTSGPGHRRGLILDAAARCAGAGLVAKPPA